MLPGGCNVRTTYGFEFRMEIKKFRHRFGERELPIVPLEINVY